MRRYNPTFNLPDKVSPTQTSQVSTESLKRLKVVHFPNPSLKKPCVEEPEVTPEVIELSKRLLLTMMLEGAVSLSAPQVGHHLRLFAVDVNWASKGFESGEPRVFINPKIEPLKVSSAEGEPLPFQVLSTEGCASFPGVGGRKTRYTAVKVVYLDLEGVETSLIATGPLSIAIQHEMDHLNGETIQNGIAKIDLMKVLKNIKVDQRKQR